MCLRRRMETGDQLRLLAGLANVEDYETPADRIAAELDDMTATPGGGGVTSADRTARIIAAADAAGGEVS